MKLHFNNVHLQNMRVSNLREVNGGRGHLVTFEFFITEQSYGFDEKQCEKLTKEFNPYEPLSITITKENDTE